MPELTGNASYAWDATIRSIAPDDGSDVMLDKVDIQTQELLNKDLWLYNNKLFVVKAQYDFAEDETEGAVGAIPLGVTIPDNAIITKAYVDVITTFTSAADTATIALHAQSAGDLVAAVAISDGSDPWDAGIQAAIPVGTAATMIKMTAARELTLTVAVQALTAGKLNLFVEYVLSD